jgi:GAF domain-containing protein
MELAPIPKDEQQRLEAVKKLKLLNTEPEDRFDKITQEAVERFGISMSTVTIIDKDTEWFKSCKGNLCGDNSGDRKSSFCGHAMLADNVFIIEDTLEDERFKDNPLVVGYPYVRFYAGVALREYSTNHRVGVFCIKDDKPHSFGAKEVVSLLELAKKAEEELNS